MDYIEVNEVKYPVFFGMLELSEYEDLSGQPLGDLFGKLSNLDQEGNNFVFPFSMSEIINITYIGLKGGAKKDKNGDFAKEQAIDLLNEGEGVFIEVLNIFAAGITKAFSPKKNTEGNAPSPKRRASKKQG